MTKQLMQKELLGQLHDLVDFPGSWLQINLYFTKQYNYLQEILKKGLVDFTPCNCLF